MRSCTRAFVPINWFDIFLWQPENLSFLLHKSNETFWWKPEKVFGGNCAQSKNLSAHLCITPTLAPQITSHLLVISSFPNLARFPHPLASRTVWHFEVKLGPHLPTVINYMKEALLAEFPNQQSLLCHPRVLLPAQYTYGSVSAGRDKWPFNVIFFFKSRASVWLNLMR